MIAILQLPPRFLLILGIMSLCAKMQAQTLVDPARAAAAVPVDLGTQALVRSQEAASSAGLEDENSYAPATPGDDDMGQQVILKRNERAYPFRVSLDASAYWTDNAANVNNGAIDDWFATSGLTMGWQQRLHGRFFADAYLSQRFYRYDELDELDYEDGQASAGLLVLLPEVMNSIFHVHYFYQRITQDIGDSPIYETHAIKAGLQKTFLINRLNSISTNLGASFALDTEPDVLRRHEYSTGIGYSYKVMRDLVLSVSYRLAYYDYFNLDGRQDWYHNGGVALSWQPTSFLELNASYNYSFNESNRDAFDYEAQMAGPAVGLKIKF